ncbi:hypothetical protein [Nocardioides lijunqiniae]|uniref:hypothetical protein n=1 Tax=Nocardioides lijunqiniae TaxID=2760832 RepID=UPI0018778710|nr:hypothetical protein [Nocardioides lijunqiniae]
MKTTKSTLTVLLAAVLLVLGFDYVTFAATGSSLVLGKTNTAGKTTQVTNKGAGPALSLRTRPNAPPLKVTSSKKVARLNADALDGLDASQLGTKVYRLEREVDVTGSYATGFTGIPAGTYAVTYSVTMTEAGGTAANPRQTECYFDVPGSPGVSTKRGYSTSGSSGYYPNLTGTTVLTNPTSWDFFCSATPSVSWDSVYSPLEIIFTRIDTVRPVGTKPAASGPPLRQR